MPKANLTDLVIKSLKSSNYGTLWDTQLRGFGMRTGLSSKTWVVMVGKQRRRITVGHYPSMPLKEARSRARTLLYKPHYHSPTLDEAIASYAQFHLQPNTKPTTAKETERMLRKHFAFFMHRKLADVTLRDITAVTDSLRATPTEANMAFTHSLIKGQHIACKELDELLAAEAAIVEACNNLKAYLETALTFDGRETLIEI